MDKVAYMTKYIFADHLSIYVKALRVTFVDKSTNLLDIVANLVICHNNQVMEMDNLRMDVINNNWLLYWCKIQAQVHQVEMTFVASQSLSTDSFLFLEKDLMTIENILLFVNGYIENFTLQPTSCYLQLQVVPSLNMDRDSKVSHGPYL